MLTLDNGKILFFTGDGIPFGSDGRASAQDDSSHLGKILLIDPVTKTFEVAAKGLRNPQHAEFVDSDNACIAFMEIGGVTAEEINVVKVSDLLDTRKLWLGPQRRWKSPRGNHLHLPWSCRHVWITTP